MKICPSQYIGLSNGNECLGAEVGRGDFTDGSHWIWKQEHLLVCVKMRGKIQETDVGDGYRAEQRWRAESGRASK